MGRSELFFISCVTSGSVQTRVKKELIESGFIAETSPFGKRKQGSLFRLSDDYSTFYLKWYEEIKNSRLPVNANYWMMLQNSPQFKIWTGYAFENVCLNHIQQIAKAQIRRPTLGNVDFRRQQHPLMIGR